MKKVFRVISNVIVALLVAAVLILVVPRFFGVKMFGVLSGSMEPAYSVGDLIYAVPTDAEKIEEGDVISFLLNEDGTVATHRVVEIDRENKQIYTKGDANELSDGRPVSYENVLGVVKFAVPAVGKLIVYMNTTPGKIITVTMILALILLILLLQGEGNKELNEENDEDYIPEKRQKQQNRRRPKVKKTFSLLEEEPEAVQPRRQTVKNTQRRKPVSELNETRKPKARERPTVEERRTVTDEENTVTVQKKEHVKAEKPLVRSERTDTARKKEARNAKNILKPSYPLQEDGHIRKQKREYPDIPNYEIPSPASAGYPKSNGEDYQYEKLQVCWKMLTLMERMWDETISSENAFKKKRSQTYKEPVAEFEFDWKEEQEEGGMDYVPGTNPGKTRHKIS